MVLLLCITLAMAIFIGTLSLAMANRLSADAGHFDAPKPRPIGSPDPDQRMCPACGDGPYHKSWGNICPNCSGAD